MLTRTGLLGWFTRQEAISAVDRELGRPGTPLVLLSSKTRRCHCWSGSRCGSWDYLSARAKLVPRLVSKAQRVHSWVYWQKQSRWLQPLIHLPSASNWQKQNPNCTEMWDVWFLSFFNTCRVLKNWCFWTLGLEKTLESPLDSKEIKPVNPKGNQPWILNRRIAAEAEAGILWPPDMKSQLIGKYPDAGKGWKQKRVTEDKMVRWRHRFNGHKLGQTLGDGEGRGSLACCSPWGCKQLDMTWWLNNNNSDTCSLRDTGGLPWWSSG